MTIIFRTFFVVAFLLQAQLLFGQNKCECDIKIPEDIDHIQKDSLKVFQFTKLFKLSASKACQFEGMNFEFDYYNSENKLNEAFKVLAIQEELLEEFDCRNKFNYDFYLNKTKYYRSINDFEKLSEFAFKALKEAEQLKDDEKEILAIKEIVFLFTRMKENEKRWSYVKRAERLILNQSESIKSVFNKRWLAFQYENEYTKTERKTLIDSALVLIDDSKKGAYKYKLYKELALNYRGLEALFYHKGELKNALMYIDSAIYYSKQIKGFKNVSGLYLSKAWDHLDLEQFDEANKWMDTALYYDKQNDIAGYMMMQFEASQIYEGTGKIDKAFNSFKTYSKLKDSLINTERLAAINDLETKYKTELKDAKIKRLNVLLIFAALIIVCILFIAKIVQLQKAKVVNEALKNAINTQLKLEKEITNVRENIAQDFHDDLGNKLARISLLSNIIQNDSINKDQKTKSKIKQITEDANNLYLGTRDFIFSLKANSDCLEELVTYLSDFGEDFFNKSTIKFLLIKDIELDVKLPYYWSKQLVYIFKEAMTNAFKHSKCNQVILKFEFSNNTLNIECIDNGIGISKENMDSVNGLNNMKSRALKIGGEFIIDSNEKTGTRIRFIGKTT